MYDFSYGMDVLNWILYISINILGAIPSHKTQLFFLIRSIKPNYDVGFYIHNIIIYIQIYFNARKNQKYIHYRHIKNKIVLIVDIILF